MADIKRRVAGNLKSAKAWIDRADKSLDDDSAVRAELDLLLAQAEIKRAREKNNNTKSRWVYPLLKQVMAFLIAVTAVTGTYYWWEFREEARVTSIASTVSPSPAYSEPVVNTTNNASKPAIVPLNYSAQANVQEISTPVKEVVMVVQEVQPVLSSKNSTEVKLSRHEMKELVKVAGKTLRE